MPGAFYEDDLNEYSDDDMINRQIRAERMRVMRGGLDNDGGDND